jgi:hypothetical protein
MMPEKAQEQRKELSAHPEFYETRIMVHFRTGKYEL